ncbi:MAG: sensor histidine kinase [Planctomycetota bacterium]|jgi:signal transduction histidine kinase
MNSSSPEPASLRPQGARPAASGQRRWVHNIGARIGVGFGIVLVLHLIVAIVGHWGISKGLGVLEAIDEERRWTGEMVEIDRLVRDMQESVLLYAFTGHESLEARVDELHQELRGLLEKASSASADQPELAEMEQVLAAYQSNFELAKGDRAKRKEIVDVFLVEKAREVAFAFGELEQSLGADRDAWRSEVSLVQREFLYAQSEVLEYVNRFEYPAVESALDRMERCLQSLASIDAQGLPAVEASLQNSRASVTEYRGLLIRMVQRTRGYLHLVNVVIAGEAAEFLRLSERIREKHVGMLEAAYEEGIAAQSGFESVSLWVSIITVVAGIFASGRISRGIVLPIRSIASTLRQLGDGEKEVAVPHRERLDEIGDMARAAEIFRDKNAETDRFLEDTRRSNRDLEQFAYVASHDLQEPLRMVASYVQLLELTYADSLDDEAREFIGFAVDGTVRMKHLINDLLAYSRVGSEGTRVEEVWFGDVLAVVKANLATTIAEREAVVELRSEDLRITVDPRQLAQLLQNLIANAIKFCRERAPRVDISLVQGDGECEVHVKDNGIGIKAEHLERIFTVFQRLHGQDEYEGTGIGLAICRRLIERIGGRIWVQSEVGVGTIFSFSISGDWETDPDRALVGAGTNGSEDA